MDQLKTVIAGAQILLVVFGATVLVPLLTGLNPTLALLGAGLGTLLLQLVTKRKVPIFLGSSFAFIVPITYSIGKWGLSSIMLGLLAAGFMYFVFAVLIRWCGLDAVHGLSPPVAIGPVIMVIGLSVVAAVSSIAVGQSGGKQVTDYIDPLILPGLTFAVTVTVPVFGSRMMKLILTLIGVASGYVLALVMGLADTGTTTNAPRFTVPHFEVPQVNWQVALFMSPVAIAPAIEHIDGIMIIGNVTGKNYTKDPDSDKTLAGDGLGVCVAGLVGGPLATTYGGVTGTVMITKDSNPIIMTWAAVFAICIAFFGKFSALLASVPIPVMDGIILLLFGTITSLGIKTLADAKVDLMQPKDLAIISSVLTIGIGGMTIKVGTSSLVGVGLCAVLATILNCVLPNTKPEEAQIVCS